MKREKREELNALSKDVFGTASRWQKLVSKGYTALQAVEEQEVVPADKEGEEPTVRTVDVPVLTENGAKQYAVEYHTVDSIREFLVAQKTQLDAIRKQLKEQQEKALSDKKAEEQAKELHRTLSGSAT